MASKSNDDFGSHKTHREHLHVPKTLGDRGDKLLANAQRVGKTPSRQRPGQLPPSSEYDSWDITIRHMETQLTKLMQILLANNIIKPTLGVGEGLFEIRSDRRNDPPRCRRKEKQVKSNAEAKSQSDNKSVVSRKHRTPPSQTYHGVDLRETLNAKWTITKIYGQNCWGAAERIEGMDSLKKFTPPKFTLYDGKSNPRSHVSHIKQMTISMHLCAKCFYQVWGDLGLKWFDKLPIGSIESFHHLIESFVTRTLSRVKMFAQLKDDVHQVERAMGSSSQGNGSFKKRRESPATYEGHLVQKGHLKEYVDQAKTQAEEDEFRPNPRGPKAFNIQRQKYDVTRSKVRHELEKGSSELIASSNALHLSNFFTSLICCLVHVLFLHRSPAKSRVNRLQAGLVAPPPNLGWMLHMSTELFQASKITFMKNAWVKLGHLSLISVTSSVVATVKYSFIHWANGYLLKLSQISLNLVKFFSGSISLELGLGSIINISFESCFFHDEILHS
ncbi:hypothetical protein Acr_00g0069660 [Actinidia rufa]|uniref:Uncharacterized protein n=1 Tax=Actinidia rufa TaxID=165716 RepID=A0A7J0DR83_9ERIC|nr:hypothetical protein Acr_00g0069660 [Actinidia rufa]